MKILLVDDDPVVLQALLDILKSNTNDEVASGTNGGLALQSATEQA